MSGRRGSGFGSFLSRWARRVVAGALSMLVAMGLVSVPAAAEAGPSVPVAAAGRDDRGPAVAADERSAVAAARQRGSRVEVLSERTEYSQTFARPDGSFVLEESVRPRWARQADGAWADVDSSLRWVNGSLKPAVATVSMRFSGGGTAPLAVMAADGVSMGLSWPSPLPASVVEGNVATYRGVAPGIDLQVVADVDGFSHLLVIRSPKALASPLVREFHLDTHLSGLSLRVVPTTGVVEAVDSAGTVVFSGPSPMMWDSRGAATAEPATAEAHGRPARDAKPAEGGRGPAAPVDVQPKMAPVAVRVSAGRLTLVPDAALLSDPDTVFPVYVDPAWAKTTGMLNNWSLLRKSFPNSSFYNPPVGSTSSSDATRGVVRAGYVVDDRVYTDRSVFNMSTSAVRYKQVYRATFSLTQSWSWYGCSYAYPPVVQLRRVSSFSSSTTWNTSWNATKSGWGAILATSAKIRRYGYSCGPQKVEYNVTGRVKEAAAAGSSSINIGLIAKYETTGNWTRFRIDPILTIEYNTIPNVPAQVRVTGKACASGSARPYVLVDQPTLTAVASDPDTGQQSLTTRFYWWPDGQSRDNSVYVSGTSANPGTATSAPVPLSKKLADDTVYRYQASTLDGLGGVSWSAVCEFETSLTPPDPPSQVTSTDYPSNSPPGSGGVGIPGDFDVSPPASGHAEIVGYAYTLDSGISAAQAPFVAKEGDGTATVTVTPLWTTYNTLRVWSKDFAGRFSSVTNHLFYVRAVNSPAARWLFDDPTNRGLDATGHGNALTLSGGAAVVAGRAGVGDALSLNGTTAVAATSSGLTQPDPDTGSPVAVRTDATFTVAGWVRLDATGGSGVVAAVALDGTRTSPYLLGYSRSSDRWVFQMAGSDVDNATLTTVTSNAAPVAGKWTHLAGTFDAQTKQLRLYVMGVAQTATATLSGTGFNTTGPLTVGRRRWNGAAAGYLAGQVDDARVYSYVTPVADLQAAAKPLLPVISFPNGDTVTAGQSLRVKFDAAGDTNVTSFKYSVGSEVLDQSIGADVPGGVAFVDLPTSQVGELRVFAATYDGALQSAPAGAAGTVVAAPAVSGVVYDLITRLPVDGATVILDPAGLEMSTGAGGTFSFTGFASGTYVLASYLGGPCGQAVSTEIYLDQATDDVELYLAAAIDTFGYSCQQVPDTPFTPVAGSALALTGDDAVASVSLPFAFPFYDTAYTSVWIDTNGLVTFTDPGGSHPAGDRNIPSPAVPNALVAAYWDDLVVDASASVHTEAAGVAPDQEFSIEWRNVHLKGDPSARISVRATLHEQGFVLVNYTGLDTAAEQGLTAVVGVESPGGEIGLQYSYKVSTLATETMVVFIRPFDAPAITTGDLTGTVVDAATGAPLTGVQVVLEQSEESVSSGTGGAFTFPDLERGSYTVEVRTSPYCGKVAQAYVDLETSAQIELAVAPVADDYGYTCLAGPRTFASAGTKLNLSGDDSNISIALPFPIDFYGETHTVAWINTNGIIIFMPQPFGWWAPHEIPSVHDSPSAAIYPMWSDWYVDGPAGVYTGTTGTAPNRVFAIEWRNVRHVNDSSARVSFQVTLTEGSDEIGVAWKDIGTNPLERGSAAVVGIENTDSTIALPYSAFEEVIASGQGAVFTPGDPGLREVNGTVTCEGTPVVGASVLLGDQTDTTDASGEYDITGVPAGPQAVIATAASGDCAGSVAMPVTTVSGQPQTVDIALTPLSQAPGYTVTVAPTSMLSTSTVVALPGTDGGDDEIAAITPPFPIELYGQAYTQAWVDTNGYLMFVNRGFSDPLPVPIPSTQWSPDAAVYPIWDDWVVDSQASVRTGVHGSAPNRTWVVEWRNVYPFNLWQRIDFQVVFDEATGQITFSYNDIGVTFVERGGAGLVGIENADSTSAVMFSHLMPVLRTGRGLVFTPTNP